jgi:hypothetical protein
VVPLVSGRLTSNCEASARQALCTNYAYVQSVAEQPGRDPRNPRRPGPGPAPALPSPVEVASVLADQAIALAPDPQLKIAPGGVGLTGLESYFWLGNDLEPITASAAVGGFTVTAEARPVQYRWDFGDDADELSFDPGRAWTRYHPGNIDHVYETRGRYRVGVEAIWEARWQLNGGPWQSLGHFSTSDGRDYSVRQIVPVLVPADAT